MSAFQPSHVAELIEDGAVTEKAQQGLASLRSLPPAEAWWVVADVIARTILPVALEDLSGRFANETVRRDAQSLIGIAAQLRESAPLPGSLDELQALVRRAEPLTHSKFLMSFGRALFSAGELWPTGPLAMTLYRWPGTDSRGYFQPQGGREWAIRSTLEAIADQMARRRPSPP